MKLLTIVGARPQFIKEALLSAEITKQKEYIETLVHIGQHYDENMSDVFFRELNMKEPDYNLGVSGGSHASMTARIMEALEAVLERENPDLALVFGDTNSTLAGALTAVKMHIPLCHVESGVRTGFLTNPEEINRLCADHIASINCAVTPKGLENLKRENLGRSSVLCGDLMLDAYKKYAPFSKNKSLSFLGLDNNEVTLPTNYYYLTCHREENSNLKAVSEILLAMEELDYPAVYPVHPRMIQFVRTASDDYKLSNTLLIQPTGYIESLCLMEGSAKVITDSGGIQREAFFAEKKCVTLLPFSASEELLSGNRNTLLETITKDSILSALQQPQTINPSFTPFGKGEAAKEIVDAIGRFFSGKEITCNSH